MAGRRVHHDGAGAAGRDHRADRAGRCITDHQRIGEGARREVDHRIGHTDGGQIETAGVDEREAIEDVGAGRDADRGRPGTEWRRGDFLHQAESRDRTDVVGRRCDRGVCAAAERALRGSGIRAGARCGRDRSEDACRRGIGGRRSDRQRRERRREVRRLPRATRRVEARRGERRIGHGERIERHVAGVFDGEAVKERRTGRDGEEAEPRARCARAHRFSTLLAGRRRVTPSWRSRCCRCLRGMVAKPAVVMCVRRRRVTGTLWCNCSAREWPAAETDAVDRPRLAVNIAAAGIAHRRRQAGLALTRPPGYVSVNATRTRSRLRIADW